jgi:endonuclease/exonuclease/phosphatase family metal-dependent hydrolase
MAKRLYRIFHSILFLFSVVVLFSPKISPATNIVFALLSLLIPFIAGLNVLLLIYFLFRKSIMSALPFVVLLVFCFQFLSATISFHPSRNAGTNGLTVFSYNVSQFAKPRQFYFDRSWKDDSLLSKSRHMIDYVATHKADIKCLQEFYNDSNSVNFNTHQRIGTHGEIFYAQSTKTLRINHATFGVAIFSRLPIVNSGELIYSNNAFNRGVFADIKFNTDTIRVVNVHLQSTQMGISLSRTFFTKWRYDQRRRAEQADLLVDFINKSPYPVILCGDMNATPYGYVYSKIADNLTNSYENKGNGLGYTFTGKGVKYLRIDHQFFSTGIKNEGFLTDHSIHFSDHFPVEGTYNVYR